MSKRHFTYKHRKAISRAARARYKRWKEEGRQIRVPVGPGDKLTAEQRRKVSAGLMRRWNRARMKKRLSALIPLGSAVKLSERGLSAGGPQFSGFTVGTLGEVVLGKYPDADILAVRVGAEVQHWPTWVWQLA